MHKSPDKTLRKLSRRERQVIDIVYSRGQATAAEIHQALSDPPTFSATRAVIRTLQEKGHLQYEEQGLRYVYRPTVPVEKVRRSALAHLVSTFFDGSPVRLMAELLDESSSGLNRDELASLEAMIRKAKEGSQ
jgi:BlaI family transcriptional regulator, penicillinase repressor